MWSRPAQRGRVGAVTEPSQAQYRLPEAGQRTGSLPGAAQATLGLQQSPDELGQFPGNVEGGMMFDHVEPHGRDDLQRDLFYLGLHARLAPPHIVRASPGTRVITSQILA